MRLHPLLVHRDAKALWEIMRQIRNACADGFTHRTSQISINEQEQYRLSFSESVRHYLYLDSNDHAVGFSRLDARTDGFVYPTYGVDPNQRGKGYAWDIVKHAMLAAGGPLKGDLLVSNKAIMHVDFGLGWVPDGPSVNGVLPVRADWPPAFANTEYTRHAYINVHPQSAYDEIMRYMKEGS